MLEFTVIDTTTNEYPDLWKIATTEEWAKHLMYCDMEGFAISEDGALLLLDECGNVAYCPADRFKVVYNEGQDDHHKQVACYTLGCQEGNKIRSEVAREVFEKIEDQLRGTLDHFRQNYDVRESGAIIVALSQIAELKKKYTEGE